MSLDDLKEAIAYLVRDGLVSMTTDASGETRYELTALGIRVSQLAANQIRSMRLWRAMGSPGLCGRTVRAWHRDWACAKWDGHGGPCETGVGRG